MAPFARKSAPADIRLVAGERSDPAPTSPLPGPPRREAGAETRGVRVFATSVTAAGGGANGPAVGMDPSRGPASSSLGDFSPGASVGLMRADAADEAGGTDPD